MGHKKKTTMALAAVLVAAGAGGGWYLWHGTAPGEPTTAKAEQKQLYTCAMHPFIVKDKPGLCPVCNMALIKKIEGGGEGGAQTPEQMKQAEMLGQVSMAATQLVMANVATVEATEETLDREIHAVGLVQFDQSRQAKVTAWIAGRIDKLRVNTVGAVIGKDQPVAEIYSPDLVAAQQEYLLALKSRDLLQNSPIEAISENGEGLVESSRQRLMLYGVKERQIAELEKGGRPNIRLPIYTPLSGVVTEKVVQQGQYVNTGDVLFNIADLSRVWVEVEVYENELPNLRLGQRVEISSQAYPGKPLAGKIGFINPFLDPKTRTVKARVEMANPGMRLKPDMFVNAVIKAPLTRGIVLPVTAAINTGKRQVVWVESAPGTFQPRDVQIGQQSGEKVQILSGVRPGDKVAVSGAYLIDSESQLRGGGAQSHGGHSAAKPGGKVPHQGGQGPKGKLSVDDMEM